MPRETLQKLALTARKLTCAAAGVLAAQLPAHGWALAATCAQEPGVLTSEYLTVLTLNVGHGRGQGRSQVLQSGEVIRQNLDAVAALLARVNTDVVALQEADAPSAWSGRFDHVTALAEAAGYPCREHGVHSDTLMSSFGTALIARVPLNATMTHRFQASPPTLSKGFVRGAISWNPGGRNAEPFTVELVSVHLDYSRASVRDTQVEEMTNALADAESLIVLGDLNAPWSAKSSAARTLSTDLKLQAFEPESEDHATYRGGKRLDWILISHSLEFVSHEVLDDQVSDHLAVLARISARHP